MHSYLPHKGIYVGDDREIRFPTRLFKGKTKGYGVIMEEWEYKWEYTRGREARKGGEEEE